MLYPYASLVESILAQRCQYTHEDPEIYLMWTVNQANWSDWPKDTHKKCPIRIIQPDLQAQLGAWPSESAWEPITRTVVFFLLINTLLASLLSVFMENLFCKAWRPGPLSLSAGLEAWIWCFHGLGGSLAGNPSPGLSDCRLKPPEVMSTQSWAILTQMEGAVNSPVLIHIFTEFWVCVINFKNWKSFIPVTDFSIKYASIKMKSLHKCESLSSLSCLSGQNLACWGILSNMLWNHFPFFFLEIFTSCFRIGFLSPNQDLILFHTSTCMNNYLKQKTLHRFLLIKLNSYVEDQFRDVCMKLNKNPCKTRSIKLPYPQQG